MKTSTRILSILVFYTMLSPSLAISQDNMESESNPLAFFERLIGGTWHLDNSYQTFDWGIGKHSVKAESFFVVEGEPRKVSEGMWFWHPGEQAVKGYFTAVQMPATLFDYTVTFEGDTMTCQLTSYSSSGEAAHYLETWTFTDEDTFQWALFSQTDEGRQKMMGGTYVREEED